MTRPERIFAIILRVFAIFAIPSFLCAFLPYSWMDATHRWLGLGSLPTEPIVGYLARSLSIFYAFVLGMLWLIASDIDRYRPVIRYYGATSVVIGCVLAGIDLHEGLPLSWALFEGINTVGWGVVFVVASYRLARRPGRS